MEKFKPIKTVKFIHQSEVKDLEIEFLEFRDGSVCLVGNHESVIFEAGHASVDSAMRYLEKAGYRID